MTPRLLCWRCRNIIASVPPAILSKLCFSQLLSRIPTEPFPPRLLSVHSDTGMGTRPPHKCCKRECHLAGEDAELEDFHWNLSTLSGNVGKCFTTYPKESCFAIRLSFSFFFIFVCLLVGLFCLGIPELTKQLSKVGQKFYLSLQKICFWKDENKQCLIIKA